MKLANIFLLILPIVLSFASCSNSPKQEIKQMTETNEQQSTILFVCEHGSAKSVVAAAHFNRLAREQNLNVLASSRGTNPDEEIPPKVVQNLKIEGLTPNEPKPKLLSKQDVTGASRVVTFCELPEGYNKLAPTEDWSDVPPISEDYNKSRDAMLVHLNQLITEIKAKK